MQHNLRTFLFALICVFGQFIPASATIEHLLPTPQQLTRTGSSFALSRDIAIADSWSDCELLPEILAEMGCRIVPSASATVTVTKVASISGASEPTLAGFDSEAYRLVVDGNSITIEAVSRLGVIRAAQTLQQLAETEGGHVSSLEGVSITDWAAFKVRGFMHDIGRSFITFEELKNQIKLYSRFKINFFQWHLTENQAWRFQVNAYPRLTDSSTMTRFPGKFYTQDECRELDALGYKYGVCVIPEIDMPGHSEAFTRAMGHDMQTSAGVQELKTVLNEVIDCFPHAPYIHLGGDEKDIKTVDGQNFLVTMSKYVHDKGQRVMWWNPVHTISVSKANGCDMAQCWSSSGRQISGLPCIDCRYNYTNHFDVFADLVGMYRSTILYKQKGDSETAGFISCPWNDRKTPTQEDIIAQNNVFAVTIASGERAWLGGGQQYIEKGGAVLPNSGSEYDDFADWERRFLFHKANSLKDEPIPYVQQTNVRWRISDPVSNGGNAQANFPWDELKAADAVMPASVAYGTKNYGWTLATGAGIYLNHTWSGYIPGIWGLDQAKNQTAYAYTYVYSDKEQTVGAQIEFQNYGRSEKDAAPVNGNWDRKGSDIWLNGTRIAPPAWDNNGGGGGDNETLLRNENFPARTPIAVTLRKGWNKVFLKLPYVDTGSSVRLNKWMFTFVLTDLKGKNAVSGLVYSPTKTLSGDEPVPEEVDNSPFVSDDEFTYYYSMKTPSRDNRYATSGGVGANMTGVTSPTNASYWKLVRRPDGDLDIVNYADHSYVSPASSNDNPLKTVASSPSRGWQLKPAATKGMFIIVSGTTEWNQTTSAHSYQVFNWGSGTNTSDPGCQYEFTINETISELPVVYDYVGVTPGRNYHIVNVQKNGDERPLYVENGELLIAPIGTAASAYGNRATFRVEGHKGQVAFRNLASTDYLIWRGNGNGYNTDKGVLSSCLDPWALWTVKASSQNGLYYFWSTRNNTSQKGSLVIMSATGKFDAYDDTEGWDARFSNLYRFEALPAGDVSTDGRLSIIDGAYIINHLNGNPDPASYDPAAADVDGNGTVNVSDVNAWQQELLK